MAQLTAELGRLGGAILELFPLTEQVRYDWPEVKEPLTSSGQQVRSGTSEGNHSSIW